MQVFITPEGKGWGIKVLADLLLGAFVFEYIGEILTNSDMEVRNKDLLSAGKGKQIYSVLLDADWGSEMWLNDEEALCLDATHFGNVARFLNHRQVDLYDLVICLSYSMICFLAHTKCCEEFCTHSGVWMQTSSTCL
jgi:hypothetical protein